MTELGFGTWAICPHPRLALGSGSQPRAVLHQRIFDNVWRQFWLSQLGGVRGAPGI